MAEKSVQMLFVGGYAPTGQAGLKAFNFDGATASLSECGSYSGITNPSFILPHPNGRWLYAVSETGVGSDGQHGDVWALRLEGGAERVSFSALNSQSTSGDWPCHLELDKTGRWLFAANYGSGSVAVFPLLADGRLGEQAHLLSHEGTGPNKSRQEGAHAHSAMVTPDNRFVIVADLGIDALVIYQFDADRGRISRHGTAATTPGAGPRHMTLNATGDLLYVANELDNSVTVYDYDADAGTLTAKSSLSTLPQDAPASDVADIHFDGTGRSLYVSNRGHNSIATYAVSKNGELGTVSFASCGGDWPRNFAVTPAGTHLLVANQKSDEVAILPIDGATGMPGEVSGTISALGPACIKFAATVA